MKTILHKADERGHADHGWLNARHSFSFANYYNPQKEHFGALRVLNDDIVQAGHGFGMHPHHNMEIVTIPLRGALEHKDSTGGHGVIRAGEVQIMSAGKGIMHSEFATAAEDVNLFQIWLFPKQANIEPRYDQRAFDAEDRQERWQMVVSPEEHHQALWINQDAYFSLGDFSEDTSYVIQRNGNGVYFMVIEGTVEIAGNTLTNRDAIGVWDTADVAIKTIHPVKLLAVEVPM